METGVTKRGTSEGHDTNFEKPEALQRLQGYDTFREGASVSTLVSVGLLVATGSIAAYISTSAIGKEKSGNAQIEAPLRHCRRPPDTSVAYGEAPDARHHRELRIRKR
jgi:hypothetical protein